MIQKIVSFVARLRREPPTCDVCETEMVYRKQAKFWAWSCPNWKRADHRVELNDGTMMYKMRAV